MDANTLSQALQSAIDQDIWNSDDSNNSDLLITPLKDIAIQWTDTGYFQIQKEKISFNDCVNGHTYSLRKTYDDKHNYDLLGEKHFHEHGSRKEWKMFQDLFVEGSNSGLFRIDAPISNDELEIDGVTWEFTKVARNGLGIGKIVNQHCFNPSTVETFLNDIIDPYYNIIKASIDVARNNSESIAPTYIPFIAIIHILKDEQGYYFTKNFDSWRLHPDKVIRQSITVGQSLIQNVGGSEVSADFLNQWTTRAFIKWTSLL
jgi:hypothetical protein